MKLTKNYIKQVIKEELQNLQEADRGMKMEIDMGTLFQGNMIKVTVSESETSHDKIVINSIDAEDAKHFVEAVAQEVPFEIKISDLSRDEQNALSAAIEKEKESERLDYATQRYDSRNPSDDEY